jgi:hypothetical protein
MPVCDLWPPAVGGNENERRRIMMWKEYGMAKEWSEFWQRSNEFDYEGMAGGEHNTMIRRANELHGELQPIDWKKFKATDIFDKEVFGTYGGERIAVSRLDYDAYVANRYDGPKDLTADQKDQMTQESGLYDYDYGSYMEKKQSNEETHDTENKDHSTYDNYSNSLYKEKAMNENQNTEQHTDDDDHMEPDSTDMGIDTLNQYNAYIDANNAMSGDIDNAIRPSHYESSNPDVPAIQMWDYALSQNLGFFEGNIIKYVSRWRQKGGVQDLQKALTYLQRLIDSQHSPNP